MIAASDPVEYVPGGRQVVLRHPASVVGKNSHTETGDTSLLQKFSHVNISGKKAEESWMIRENDSCEEEELYYSGRVAIHLKGSPSTRVLQTSYTCETDIKHALWYTFQTRIPDQLSKGKEAKEDNCTDKGVNCICLLDSYTLKVFTESGENYVSSLQFQVTGVWPTKYGILLEKNKNALPLTRYTSLESSKSIYQYDTQLPVVYSLSHPLDEICPVLIKHGSISYMCEPHQQIIFTSYEPSLAMVYDKKTGLHSVYKVRKATIEECQLVCGSSEIPNSMLNYSGISHLNAGSNNSSGKSCSAKTHLHVFGNPALGMSNILFGSKTTSYTTVSGSSPCQQQQTYHHSRSQSPMATISRCQSPTHSAFLPVLGVAGSSTAHHSRLHQTTIASLLGQTFHSPTINSNCNAIQFQDSACSNPSKPLYPEICLDHVWTESSNISKDVVLDRASKVFLTSDVVGQNYLSYLVPSRSQLFLVRLERTNKEQQVIFGMVTSIVAKDAVNLNKLCMIAIMDTCNSIALYSGIMLVGRMHLPNLMTSNTGCNYLLSGINQKLGSPFPRRSSLISPNCSSPLGLKFEEDVHLLSPVGIPYSRASNFMDNSLTEHHSISLKDAVGNKLTLEYGNQNYYRITLPSSSTSPLVSKCLHTLKSVLQRDLAIQLLVKWYGARNAPGPQDFSPTEEWHLFLVVLFTLLGYEVDKLHLIQLNETDNDKEENSPIVLPKKQKISGSGCAKDWFYVMNSSLHKRAQPFMFDILSISNFVNTLDMNELSTGTETNTTSRINTQAILFPYIPLVMFSLHLLYEELKLNCEMSESLPLLAQLLYQLSLDLRFHTYVDHYFRDFPQLCGLCGTTSQISDANLQKITSPNYMPLKPPNVFETLDNLLNYVDSIPYPYLSQVNPKTKNVIQLTALIVHEGRAQTVDINRLVRLIVPVGSRVEFSENGCKTEKDVQREFEHPIASEIVHLYHEMGMTKEELQVLPPAIALMLKDVMYRCREQPPSNWSKGVYELVDRQDLAALEKHANTTDKTDYSEGDTNDYKVTDPEQDDGMGFDDTILKLRFNKDHRVAELRRLLNSSQPVKIAIVQRPDVSDHEFIEEQERHLHALCTRTMALPVARGMFTLRTSTPVITEQLPIPRLCLTGKAPPRGTTVELAHIDVPPNMNMWPLFHNGVAAGLRIHPDSSNIDSTWIVYNKQQQGELGIEHSGFLMALGLNGHLKNLAPFSTYEYLVEYHEATSVGLLLGLSATHRGTMDVSMTKLLSLHVETLLPPTSIELNVHQNVQVAALMGVGLVYQGTAHRHIAHALLSEIGRPPGPEMKNCVDRESYSLAAGMALGLVVLGHGKSSDLANIPDTLHYYMIGGNIKPLTGAQKDKYKSPSYQIREGDSINIDVTSPGATIALGLMYFNSGNHAVAEWMRAPETQYLLDFVRPDFLLLRILARSLILWDEIQPTKTWISSHVPDIVYKYRLQKPTPEIMQEVDLETMNQAYCNIIAGACLALGLKYAGTANQNAYRTLYNYTEMFTTLSHKSIAELAGKSTIETCLNVILLSAAVVMAGTGDLGIMRVCRHIRTRVGPASSVVTYGSHLATHMALGLLFLGGGRYTLSNSPSAIAALIISLFPKFPTHSNDNRYHLQALRHLYVLAAEPRLLLPKDIDNNQYCYATVQLTFASKKLANGQEVVLKAPCLLPQLDSLKKVILKDDRYWQIVFEQGHNWHQLEGMLKKCNALDVKQRAGCLSYQEDPHGFRSLVAQTLTTEDVVIWAARPEHITSFTNDRTVLNIVKYFLNNLGGDSQEDTENMDTSLDKISQDSSKHLINGTIYHSFDKAFESTSQVKNISQTMESALTSVDISCKIIEVLRQMSNEEHLFLQTFATIVYECVVKDKVSLIPLWVNLYKTVEEIGKRPSCYAMCQIKLISSHVLCKNYCEERNQLLSLESILAIKQKTAQIIDLWESELQPLIREYTITGTVAKADTKTLQKLCAYLTFYNIPYKMDSQLISNPFTSNQAASEVSIITLYKLFKIMKLSNCDD